MFDILESMNFLPWIEFLLQLEIKEVGKKNQGSGAPGKFRLVRIHGSTKDGVGLGAFSI